MDNFHYSISFPKDRIKLPQNQESFILEMDGKSEEIPFIEYDRIYSIPHLYDCIFEKLEYKGPESICKLFSKVLSENNVKPSDLILFEPGAGCGMVGRHLKKMGIDDLTGLDILESAKLAATRDKPGLYKKYYAQDLTNLSAQTEKELKAKNFNCTVIASAGGGGHIPVLGLEKILKLLNKGGWLIFYGKRDNDTTRWYDDAKNWIDKKIEEKAVKLVERQPCFHRLSISQEPIFYEITIGIKN